MATMDNPAYWNGLADRLEEDAAALLALASDALSADWAAEGYDDSEVAGRNAARFSIAEKAAARYRRAGDHRRRAFDLVAPKAEAAA